MELVVVSVRTRSGVQELEEGDLLPARLELEGRERVKQEQVSAGRRLVSPEQVVVDALILVGEAVL